MRCIAPLSQLPAVGSIRGRMAHETGNFEGPAYAFWPQGLKKDEGQRAARRPMAHPG
jgi:hypothetical protein